MYTYEEAKKNWLSANEEELSKLDQEICEKENYLITLVGSINTLVNKYNNVRDILVREDQMDSFDVYPNGIDFHVDFYIDKYDKNGNIISS